MPEGHLFRLYINSDSQSSIKENIDAFLKERLGTAYTLEVVDIKEGIEKARNDSVFVAPTLIKIFPPPKKRIIGDLSSKDRALLVLGI